jgi:hypothetical protein
MEIEITTRMGTMRAATTAMVPTRIQASISGEADQDLVTRMFLAMAWVRPVSSTA